jgi:hypothetical protein
VPTFVGKLRKQASTVHGGQLNTANKPQQAESKRKGRDGKFAQKTAAKGSKAAELCGSHPEEDAMRPA